MCGLRAKKQVDLDVAVSQSFWLPKASIVGAAALAQAQAGLRASSGLADPRGSNSMGFSVAAARDGLAVRGFHRMLMTAARGPRVTHVWPNRASSALARARAQFHIGGAGARVRRLQPAKRRLGAIGMPVNALSEWLVVRGSTRWDCRRGADTSFCDAFGLPENPNIRRRSPSELFW